MRYPLPYAFARRHQLLVEQQDDGSLLLWHGHGVPPGPAWSEVQRKHRIASVQAIEPPQLAQRISTDNAQGESSAASVVWTTCCPGRYARFTRPTGVPPALCAPTTASARGRWSFRRPERGL